MISSSIDPKLAAANLAMQAKLAHYGIAGLIWPNGTISKLFHYNGWHMPTYYLDWSADQSYDVLIYLVWVGWPINPKVKKVQDQKINQNIRLYRWNLKRNK